jgi:hypothetical protein
VPGLEYGRHGGQLTVAAAAAGVARLETGVAGSFLGGMGGGVKGRNSCYQCGRLRMGPWRGWDRVGECGTCCATTTAYLAVADQV